MRIRGTQNASPLYFITADFPKCDNADGLPAVRIVNMVLRKEREILELSINCLFDVFMIPITLKKVNVQKAPFTLCLQTM